MPPWAPPPLPSWFTAGSHPPFVGRGRELARLEELWGMVERGSRQALFLGGEPGSGKTRLVIELATALHEQDFAVLVGSNYPELSRPYQPLVEAVNHLLLSASPGQLGHLLLDGANELLRITPHVRRHLPDLVDPMPVEHEYRMELFEAFSQFLAAVAAEKPLALILEDMHWSSAPSRLLLSHVIQTTSEVPLLVLATMRTQAPDRSDDLALLIADLYRLPGVSRLDLEGLESAEIEAYLRQEGATDRDYVKETAAILRDQTGGNPFFVREMWKQMSQSGGFRAFRTGSFAPPPTVREAIDRRITSLSQTEQTALGLAAVVGDTFDVRDIAAASGRSREETLGDFDRAVAYGLLRADEHTAFSFQHSLIRQALLAGLPVSRSAKMHARLAETIEPRYAAEPHLATLLARLYGNATALGYEEKAARYLSEAAHLADRGLAHEEAAQLFEQAARLAPDEHDRESWLLASADSHLQAANFAEARRIYREVHASSDPKTSLQAATGFENASWRPGHHGQEALTFLEASLAAVPADGSDPGYISAFTALGRAHTFAGNVAEAARIGAAALEMARSSRDDRLIAEALSASLLQVRSSPGSGPITLQKSIELREIAIRTGEYDGLGPAGSCRAFAAYMGGNVAGWYSGWEDIQTAVRKTAQPLWEWVAGCHEYCHHFMQGEFETAEAVAERIRDLGYGFGSDDTEGPYGLQMYLVRRESGQLESVRPLVSGSGLAMETWRPGLLALYTELGIDGPAQSLLWELLNNLRSAEKGSGTWPAILVFLAEAAVHLKDLDAIEVVTSLMAEWEGYNLVAGQSVVVFGSSDRYLGEMAAVAGGFNVAEDHFVRALAADEETRSVVHQGETLAKYAAMLDQRGDPGDVRRAEEMRGRARLLATPIGHHRVLRMISAPRPAELPNGLTRREIDVLRLLAVGASNKEIGDRLFISQNTAANHVRNILMKTASANRTQAAIYAAEHDLLG